MGSATRNVCRGPRLLQSEWRRPSIVPDLRGLKRWVQRSGHGVAPGHALFVGWALCFAPSSHTILAATCAPDIPWPSSPGRTHRPEFAGEQLHVPTFRCFLPIQRSAALTVLGPTPTQESICSSPRIVRIDLSAAGLIACTSQDPTSSPRQRRRRDKKISNDNSHFGVHDKDPRRLLGLTFI